MTDKLTKISRRAAKVYRQNDWDIPCAKGLPEGPHHVWGLAEDVAHEILLARDELLARALWYVDRGRFRVEKIYDGTDRLAIYLRLGTLPENVQLDESDDDGLPF